MRNPALRLVGTGVSPQGGGVFGTRAEEELRLWLESRLDALGIDPIAYSRFVLSLLRRPDSALSPPHGEAVDNGGRTAGGGGGGGRRHRVKPRPRIQGNRDQRYAVVQCLTNAADQKCGVESLVDELCSKLRDLEGGDGGGGGGSNLDKVECQKLDGVEKNTAIETLTPRDRALRYYAAFPALQPATPKKTIYKKEKNTTATINNNHKNRIIGVSCNNNTNSNKNNNNNSNTGSNTRGRHRKSKMPIQTIDAQRSENKETFGFAKSMEREREKERELELDQLRLAQLQAKFDESLEALWDTGPNNAHDKASIWAAPSLSIPSGPLWPIDTGDMPLILPINETISTANTTPYHDDSIIDDSPIIPWDIDSFGKCTDDSGGKDKIDYNLNWSDYICDGPWHWKTLDNNLMNIGKSPKTTGCFIPVTPRKSPIVNNINNNNNNNNNSNNNNNNNNNNNKESSSQEKVNSLEEVDEDLLTSARTHFRPIKDDGHWADGTTFPVNNNIERVSYRRSESGNLLYLPGDESPYMEYRESITPSPTISSTVLTLKFRVRQCDKSIQTDPIRSPVKRRIIAEADHFYYSSIDTDDILTHESDDIEKDTFTLGRVSLMQPSVSLLNDRKRRHSSSFHCRPLAALRPFTL